MSELSVGAKAPAFSVPDQTGKTISLDDFAGETVILYFYPKDDTPGCTTEACSFRDSHVPLLADEGHKIAEAYGVWVEKSMYGRKYMGVERTTFVIDGAGKIAAIHRKVKPAEHVDDLMASL